MNNESWYALKVRPRHEATVAEILQLKGYKPFVPKYKSRRVWSDRIKTMELPLFPGYLFCQFDLLTRLPILTTPGVSFIVGNGKVPQPIDNAEIDALQTVVSAGVPYRPHPFLNIGQRIRIVRGSLTGLEGFVTQLRNEFRLVVSVNLLMRSVCVDIDESWVEPIKSGSSPEWPVATGRPLTSTGLYSTTLTQGLSKAWNPVKEDAFQPSKLRQ